jgi:CheY-like chemotaxis protein
MDIQMPVMDGYTAIQHIRNSDSERNDIPIYALTGYTSDKDIQRVLDAGATGHLGKPITNHDIESILYGLPAGGAASEAESEHEKNEYEKALARFREKPDFYGQLIGDAAETIQQRLREIREALEARETEPAARLLHSVAGIAATCGLEDLRRIALAFEMELLGSDVDFAPKRLEHVEHVAQDALATLEQIQEELKQLAK